MYYNMFLQSIRNDLDYCRPLIFLWAQCDRKPPNGACIRRRMVLTAAFCRSNCCWYILCNQVAVNILTWLYPICSQMITFSLICFFCSFFLNRCVWWSVVWSCRTCSSKLRRRKRRKVPSLSLLALWLIATFGK